MSEPVFIAVISGVFAIVAPILTYVFTKLYKNRDFKVISQSRKVALDGSWSGDIFQTEGLDNQPLTYPVSITLTVSKKEVIGTGEVDFPVSEVENHAFNISLTGGFLHERFLKLDYKNTNLAAVQFGSSLLTLSSDGTKLNGRFLGYGAKTERLVFGEIKLQKKT